MCIPRSTLKRKAERKKIRHSQELEKKWKSPMECTPRTNLGVLVPTPSFLLSTPKLVADIPSAFPTVMKSQAVIHKCSIYRRVNSKCQIQYHEIRHQTGYRFMKARTLSCSYSSNAMKGAKHIVVTQ